MSERKQLEQAIAAQESMRAALGDDVADAAIAALREKLAALAPEAARRKMRGSALEITLRLKETCAKS